MKQSKALGLESIAIPPLGCGNGGLLWSDVKPLTAAASELLPGVRMVVFEPTGAPPAAAVIDRRKTPKMTKSRAALLKLMAKYQSTGS